MAVNLENRPELLATVIGCAKLGVCAALLNTSQRGKVLVHSFNLVAPKAAIIGAEQVAAIREVRDRLDLKEHFLYFADHDTLADPGEAPEGYVNLAEAIRHRASDNPASSQRTFLRDPLFTSIPPAPPASPRRWCSTTVAGKKPTAGLVFPRCVWTPTTGFTAPCRSTTPPAWWCAGPR